MDAFEAIKATFFQECDELIADLESKLMLLEQGRTDLETINAVFRAVRAVLPGMIERGSGEIIVTSSIAGHQALHWEPVYSATKHAVQAFVHGVRRQAAPHGIRVGAVAPGVPFGGAVVPFGGWGVGPVVAPVGPAGADDTEASAGPGAGDASSSAGACPRPPSSREIPPARSRRGPPRE